MGHDLDPVKLAETELTKIAQLDDKITEEEKRTIDGIIEEMKKYKLVLDNALEDSKITPEEKKALFASKLEVIKNTVQIMNNDFNVSKDEEAILEGLHNLLARISKEERKFK